MTPEDLGLVIATGFGIVGLAFVLAMLWSARLSYRRRRRFELEQLRDDPEGNEQ